MRSGKIKEVAMIPFEVMIDAESLGQYDLLIDHAEARIANQSNSPTYLNWSSMIDIIRKQDFRGWWLELSRLSEDSFRLRLLRKEPT